MSRYFHKELLTNRIYFSNGQQVNFTAVDDHSGVYEAANDKEATDLAGYIEKRRGGVTEISEENFEALKKNSKFSKSAKSLIEQPLRIIQTTAPVKTPETPEEQSVRLAKEQASARAAAGQNPVAVVAVKEPSVSKPKPVEKSKAPKPAAKATVVKMRPMAAAPASGA